MAEHEKKPSHAILPNRRLTTGRVIILIISIIVQISWFVAIFTEIVDYSIWVNLLFILLSLIMILYLVNKDENPAYRMGWLIVICLFPVFGGVLYLLFGNKRPTKRMSRRLNEQIALHRQELMRDTGALNELFVIDPRVAGLSDYIHGASDSAVRQHTNVDYYPNGESVMPALLAALRSAEKHIFMEYFIIEQGEMTDAIFSILESKAKQGVDVRLMYDDFGCLNRLPNDFDKQMEALGIKCLKFNPFTPVVSMAVNTRDHRKIIVVDGKIGFTGGMNLADEYINVVERFGYWKDNMIKLEGPAVWNLTVLFLEMWHAFYPKKQETVDSQTDYEQLKALSEQYQWDKVNTEELGFVQPYGDSPLDSEPLGENVYRDILNSAVDYVYIYTPYLVISYELQTALTLAAKRGVDVRLMTPGIPDKKLVYRLTRSFYPALLKAGVRVFEFTPGFLHAKTFISDDRVATIGSINMDYRSLYLHFEVGVMLAYHRAILDMKEDYLTTEAHCREVTLADCQTTWIGHLWNSVLGIIAPLV